MRRGRINAGWHRAHPMPRNPTREQRVEWHGAHAAACGCRPVPQSLLLDVRRLKAKRGRSD